MDKTKMKIPKSVKTLPILVCTVIYAYSAIGIDTGPIYNLTIDTSKPESIEWPFEIAVVGDIGEKGLRIAPKIGRGWRGEAAGQAAYRFYIPKNDTYNIWAYCLWFDECANAVFAQIDDMDKAILGNDPIYNQWHWVRGFSVNLRRGTHTIVLSNHSDHIALRKVLFTNSDSLTPEDRTPVFSDIFYDGFDGCDRGNFDKWQVLTGHWTVESTTQSNSAAQNALLGQSEDTALIIHQGDTWSNYTLNAAVKTIPSQDSNAVVALCFAVNDPHNYHQLSWQRDEEAGTAKMRLCSKTSETTKLLAEFEVPWHENRWHHLEIAINEKAVTIKIDDGAPVAISVNHRIGGGIGLCLEGKIRACFDNIHVTKSGQI